MLSQLPLRLLGQQIPHQRLARRVDKGVGETRAKHPEGDEPEGVAEPEQQVGAARQNAAEQQYGAPAKPVGEPADVKPMRQESTAAPPSSIPMPDAERSYSR